MCDFRPVLRRFRALTLRVQLLLLVAVALLPALGVMVLRDRENRQDARREARRNCMMLAEGIRTQEELGAESIRQLLASLAHFPAVEAPGPALDGLLRDFQKENSQLASLFVTDPSGRIYAANGAFAGLSIADRPYFRELLRTRRFTVGGYALSRISGQPVQHFAYPVLDAGGRLKAVLGAGAGLARYDNLLAFGRMPEGTRVVLLDHGGTVMYASASQPPPGTPFEPEALRRMAGPAGVLREGTKDGAILVGYRQVVLGEGQAPYLTVRVEMPEGPWIARSNAKLFQDLLFLGLGALAAGACAWLLGELLIARRVRRLAQATARLAEGQMDQRLAASMPGGELGDLARAFDEMAAALAQREAERNQAAQERQELQERLRQGEKLEAIGQLAGGVAHDFNNQLAAIMGFAEILVRQLEDPIQQERAQKILRACERSADLTHKLLAFARKGKYRNEPVDLHALVEEVAALLEHSLDKRIRLELELTAERPFLLGDSHQLQNALLNLALNARDAMPDGGTLRFRSSQVVLEPSALGRIHGEPMPGEYLALEVEDTGTGIPPELLERIFEPFFTTKGPGRGTGLGLASVYGTLQAHQGGLDVHSEVGCGTRFRLYLPRMEAGLKTQAPQASEVAPAGSAVRPRVLVVEDEPLVGGLMGESLQEAGFEALCFAQGAEAVAWVRSHPGETDLVLLDLVMPGMSGREVFHALQALEPGLRVLLVSGYSEGDDVQDLLEAGALGLLGKPFRLAKLKERIQELLQLA